MRMPMADSLVALVGAFLGVVALILLRGNSDPLVWAPVIGVAAALAIAAVWHGMRAPAVLVVGDADTQAINGLEGTLSYDGLAVRRCTGPVGRHCPVLSGEPCPYGDGLALAVVQGAHDGLDAPPCERGVRAPVVYYQADTTDAVVPVVRQLLG